MNQNYSTTRLTSTNKPVIMQNIENVFKGQLFFPDSECSNGKGGLRVNGYFKQSFKDKPLVTVITVVYNSEGLLEKTIQSIINQSYENVEYVVVDGGSSDGTVRIVKQYEYAIDYWISNPDRGIFHAMNKGASLATGDYVYFLNAGDVFYSNSVLSDIFNHQFQSAEIGHTLIVGNVMLTHQNNDFGLANRFGTNIPHQGAFVKRSVFFRVNFNEELKVFGDGYFWAAMKNNGLYMPYFIEDIVCGFPMDGVGSSPDYIWKRFAESKSMLLRNKKYIAILRKFFLALFGYSIYRLFGSRGYFYGYVKVVNAMIKLRG